MVDCDCPVHVSLVVRNLVPLALRVSFRPPCNGTQKVQELSSLQCTAPHLRDPQKPLEGFLTQSCILLLIEQTCYHSTKVPCQTTVQPLHFRTRESRSFHPGRDEFVRDVKLSDGWPHWVEFDVACFMELFQDGDDHAFGNLHLFGQGSHRHERPVRVGLDKIPYRPVDEISCSRDDQHG